MSGRSQTNITIRTKGGDGLQADLERAELLCVFIRGPKQRALTGSLRDWQMINGSRRSLYLFRHVPLDACAGPISSPASLATLSDEKKRGVRMNVGLDQRDREHLPVGSSV